MGEVQSRLESTRRMAALVRELFLIGIIALLIFSPKTIRGILQNAGIKSFAGIEFRNDLEKTANETKKAIHEITTLRDSLNTLNLKLGEAIAQSSDMNTRNELRAIQSTVNATSKKASDLDQNLKNSFSTQRNILEEIDLSEKKEVGWIKVGKTNEAKSRWDDGRPQNVVSASLPIQPGALLKIKTDTYLRGDTNSHRSGAEALTVVKRGRVVEVIEVDFSPVYDRRGGWTVWAKVRLN